MSMHAGARARLAERLRRDGVPGESIVLLQGGSQPMEYDTDRELLFLQESFFQYLFGVKEPGFYGAVEVGSGRSTLFMPRLGESWAVWMGRIHSARDVQARYGVDEVRYVDEMASVLRGRKPAALLLLQGKNSDSEATARPASFPGIEEFTADTGTLYPHLVEGRLRKSEDELRLLRWINETTSAAHVEVMRRARPGMMEYQLEALFNYEIYARSGCRFTAYTNICGCGPNAAVLHYGHQGAPNDRRMEDGELFLNDSGAEYHGYASDVTCTYPVNGHFTGEQKAIYEAVLAANRAVQQAMRPGVPWPDMHRLSYRVVTERLRDIGLLKGSVDDLVANHVPALFMPHGLGHLLGLDVHDCGGWPEGTQRIDEPGIRTLRCGRALEAGMVITVEPGIYFIETLLGPALADPKTSRWLDADRLERYRRLGGVRIEDDVIVTPAGSENMTHVPRGVDEVESVMAGAAWEPRGAAALR